MQLHQLLVQSSAHELTRASITLDTDYDQRSTKNSGGDAAQNQATSRSPTLKADALKHDSKGDVMDRGGKQAAGNIAAITDSSDNKTAQSDKSDDRALLLHSNHQQPEMAAGGPGGLKSVTAAKGQAVIGGASQRGKVASSTGSQLNHTNVMSSTTTGGPGDSTGRAYLASDNERHKRKLAKARERRATLILGLIMAAFICSWLPFFTFYVMRAVCTVCRDYIPPRFEAVIFWLGYCNSAINPIIYTIFNRDFRKAFRKILFKCL